jgi:hypothetical protein
MLTSGVVGRGHQAIRFCSSAAGAFTAFFVFSVMFVHRFVLESSGSSGISPTTVAVASWSSLSR